MLESVRKPATQLLEKDLDTLLKRARRAKQAHTEMLTVLVIIKVEAHG